jgi:hypothetical protein
MSSLLHTMTVVQVSAVKTFKRAVRDRAELAEIELEKARVLFYALNGGDPTDSDKRAALNHARRALMCDPENYDALVLTGWIILTR